MKSSSCVSGTWLGARLRRLQTGHADASHTAAGFETSAQLAVGVQGIYLQARVQLPEAELFGLRSCKTALRQAALYLQRFWESGRSRTMQVRE